MHCHVFQVRTPWVPSGYRAPSLTKRPRRGQVVCYRKTRQPRKAGARRAVVRVSRCTPAFSKAGEPLPTSCNTSSWARVPRSVTCSAWRGPCCSRLPMRSTLRALVDYRRAESVLESSRWSIATCSRCTPLPPMRMSRKIEATHFSRENTSDPVCSHRSTMTGCLA